MHDHTRKMWLPEHITVTSTIDGEAPGPDLENDYAAFFYLRAQQYHYGADLLRGAMGLHFMTDRDDTTMTSTVLGAVVLVALATECALKALGVAAAIPSAAGHRTYKRTHDLTTLYGELHELHLLVEGRAREADLKDVAGILDTHRGDFVGLRYPFQERSVDMDLFPLVKVLLAVYDELYVAA